MAQKEVVSLVDDLDGTSSDDITTVNFSLDGTNYEIDLTDRNAGHLRDNVANFVSAARRTGGRVKRSAVSTGLRPDRLRTATRRKLFASGQNAKASKCPIADVSRPKSCPLSTRPTPPRSPQSALARRSSPDTVHCPQA
jgi:Lsr2 protein